MRLLPMLTVPLDHAGVGTLPVASDREAWPHADIQRTSPNDTEARRSRHHVQPLCLLVTCQRQRSVAAPGAAVASLPGADASAGRRLPHRGRLALAAH